MAIFSEASAPQIRPMNILAFRDGQLHYVHDYFVSPKVATIADGIYADENPLAVIENPIGLIDEEMPNPDMVIHNFRDSSEGALRAVILQDEELNKLTAVDVDKILGHVFPLAILARDIYRLSPGRYESGEGEAFVTGMSTLDMRLSLWSYTDKQVESNLDKKKSLNEMLSIIRRIMPEIQKPSIYNNLILDLQRAVQGEVLNHCLTAYTTFEPTGIEIRFQGLQDNPGSIGQCPWVERLLHASETLGGATLLMPDNPLTSVEENSDIDLISVTIPFKHE